MCVTDTTEFGHKDNKKMSWNQTVNILKTTRFLCELYLNIMLQTEIRLDGKAERSMQTDHRPPTMEVSVRVGWGR